MPRRARRATRAVVCGLLTTKGLPPCLTFERNRRDRSASSRSTGRRDSTPSTSTRPRTCARRVCCSRGMRGSVRSCSADHRKCSAAARTSSTSGKEGTRRKWATSSRPPARISGTTPVTETSSSRFSSTSTAPSRRSNGHRNRSLLPSRESPRPEGSDSPCRAISFMPDRTPCSSGRTTRPASRVRKARRSSCRDSSVCVVPWRSSCSIPG